jgi:hypothetical protein
MLPQDLPPDLLSLAIDLGFGATTKAFAHEASAITEKRHEIRAPAFIARGAEARLDH